MSTLIPVRKYLTIEKEWKTDGAQMDMIYRVPQEDLQTLLLDFKNLIIKALDEKFKEVVKADRDSKVVMQVYTERFVMAPKGDDPYYLFRGTYMLDVSEAYYNR